MVTDDNDVLLQLKLLDNGIDFILKGIDELFDEQHVWSGYSSPIDVSPARYKYGYLHLWSGFLLLLKERLSLHLPELIFKGKIPDIRQKLASGEPPNTVDLAEALERLEIGPKVVFSPEHLKTIKRMQHFRNLFEHYSVQVNKYELWATVSDFLEIIDMFLMTELQISLETSADSIELSRKIQTIESVWDRTKIQREKELEAELQYRLSQFQKTREAVLKDLEIDYLASKGSIQLYINCPNCFEETLIVHDEFAGICANPDCYSTNLLTKCGRCGEIIVGSPWEFNLCESCESWWREQ